MKIAILLFEQADLLDSGGPYEVFLTASRLAARRGEPEPFELVTVSLDGQAVTAYGGMRLLPHGSLADHSQVDLLIVPGAIDIDTVLQNQPLLDAIRLIAAQPETVVASVCTGAFLLAETGLLDNRSWTTHWEDIDQLATRLPAELARRTARWVDCGKVVSSAGLSSGMAMALHLVHRLESLELAQATARQLDYDWSPDAGVSV